MESKKSKALALFKYGIIAPVLYENTTGQNKYFKQVSQKSYTVPYLGVRRYKWPTFKKWLKQYRQKGFKGLHKKERSDKGIYKKIPPDLEEKIKKILHDNEAIKTSTEIHRTLLRKNIIYHGQLGETTIRKFVRQKKLLNKSSHKERKKFEMEHINQLWVADFTEIRILTPSGKKTKRVYLCGILDDFSRVLVGFNWSFHENIQNLTFTLKKAIKRFGLPQKFYCDNGSSFVSQAFMEITANLKIALIHSLPRDPASRGKIERFFRTVKLKFVPQIYNQILTIEQINTKFENWLEEEYHKVFHNGIRGIPLNKYLDDIKNIPLNKITDDELEKAFLTTIKRKVREDATISINKTLYEVNPAFIGQKITLKFSPEEPEAFLLFNPDDNSLTPITKLDAVLNANSPHISLSYSKLLQQEEK